MTREEAVKELKNIRDNFNYTLCPNEVFDMAIKALEQEPTSFQWCTDCKEYDQEKHCCHRWSKVIRNAVEEMKQEQEPFIDKIRTDVAPVIHAKWIINKERTTVCCSNCSSKYKNMEDEIKLLNTAFKGLNYCTYCGAIMDKE